MTDTVSVLGAGSWGSALSLLLAKNVERVVLWGYEPQQLSEIDKTRCNSRYLPGSVFPDNIETQPDLNKAVKQSDYTIVVVPSFAFRETLKKIQHPGRFIIATKGLDPKTHDLLHTVIKDELGEVEFAILSGPTFAKEVAAGKPSAAVMASTNLDFARECQALFHVDTFRVYAYHDVIGVEICGVLKNILAVGAGISDGMQLGANARAAFLTRGVAEMRRLICALGGEEQTLLGLAGIGDLMLTAMGDLSRNRRFGLAMGQGMSVEQASRDVGQVVEGFENVKQVKALANDHQLDMPIVNELYAILYENLDRHVALQNLLLRDPTSE